MPMATAERADRGVCPRSGHMSKPGVPSARLRSPRPRYDRRRRHRISSESSQPGLITLGVKPVAWSLLSLVWVTGLVWRCRPRSPSVFVGGVFPSMGACDVDVSLEVKSVSESDAGT
jgi:hypothetical protein